jgi:dTDP-4-dehydrorhamnose 3,5-epimerase-like enzyme
MKKCKLITLPKISDTRGSLIFIESGTHVNFDVKRVFYIYDVRDKRGGHAHKKCKQVLIAINGEFDVIADNGHEKEKYTLENPYTALYVPEMTWIIIENFSDKSICLVLCSDIYDEKDYMRNYDTFLNTVKI